MIETKERRREIGLRVIGLCMVYIRGLVRGSEREREAYRMLAMYRASYRRETGEEATELMVIEAMRRRRLEMEGKESVVANSCNQYRHEPGCNGVSSTSEKKETSPKERKQEKKTIEIHSDKQHEKKEADKKPKKKSKKEALEEVATTPAGKSIHDTLEKLSKRADGDEPSPQHIGFKQVEPKTAAKVTEFYGGDYSDYEHSIAEKDIQHAKQHHPDLTDEDFMLIPDITANWDDLIKRPSKKKGNRIRYIKTYGDTTYILAERVGSRKKDNPRLMFTTIFFKKETN